VKDEVKTAFRKFVVQKRRNTAEARKTHPPPKRVGDMQVAGMKTSAEDTKKRIVPVLQDTGL
jgi:hypothetical protein